jgi:hypothetical protein
MLKLTDGWHVTKFYRISQLNSCFIKRFCEQMIYSALISPIGHYYSSCLALNNLLGLYETTMLFLLGILVSNLTGFDTFSKMQRLQHY